MNLDPTDEQELIRKTAADFAQKRLRPQAAERDQSGAFPEAELRELGALGLLGVNVPQELGGSEAGVVAYSLALSEIAAADASVSVAMAVTNMVAEVICAYGTEAQRRRHVPRLCSGEALVGAFALSEPQAGSDAAALRTSATKIPGGYRISGAKQWITSGDRAGVLVVWARTDGESPGGAGSLGARGISAFLVEGGAPGMVVGRAEDKMGLRGSSTVPLLFDGCEVPDDALLGAPGEGFRIAMAALDGGRIGIASQALGVGREALHRATAYARERRQFGQPLASFGAIQGMIADGTTQWHAARLLTLRAALAKEARARTFSREAAMAKLYASEMAGRVCDMAIQVHGGYGYTREYTVERLARDARVQRIYEGTSEVQRMVIARALLKELSEHV